MRTAQLVLGCTARVPASHRPVLTAQLEAAAGKVAAIPSSVHPSTIVAPPTT
jgi:hypothetical protein